MGLGLELQGKGPSSADATQFTLPRGKRTSPQEQWLGGREQEGGVSPVSHISDSYLPGCRAGAMGIPVPPVSALHQECTAGPGRLRQTPVGSGFPGQETGGCGKGERAPKGLLCIPPA